MLGHQAAVDHACEVMHRAVNNFNEAAKKMQCNMPKDNSEHKALKNYIDVLKTNLSVVKEDSITVLRRTTEAIYRPWHPDLAGGKIM